MNAEQLSGCEPVNYCILLKMSCNFSGVISYNKLRFILGKTASIVYAS